MNLPIHNVGGFLKKKVCCEERKKEDLRRTTKKSNARFGASQFQNLPTVHILCKNNLPDLVLPVIITDFC